LLAFIASLDVWSEGKRTMEIEVRCDVKKRENEGEDGHIYIVERAAERLSQPWVPCSCTKHRPWVINNTLHHEMEQLLCKVNNPRR
jgi:hypothetical protein